MYDAIDYKIIFVIIEAKLLSPPFQDATFGAVMYNTDTTEN